jgi:NADH:ubiquinone oxidoreductase subunit 4 (subunit M)
MLLISLLFIPLIGILMISIIPETSIHSNIITKDNIEIKLTKSAHVKQSKTVALAASILNLLVSLVIFILFNFSTNQFQFVQEYHKVNSFDFYLGVDGISIYFVLLTTIIIPVSLLSN